MAETMVALQGSTPSNKHPKIGPADGGDHVEVTIKLRRKTRAGLPTTEEFIDGKRAVGVTRQILADRYGASADDVEAVRKWAVTHGLSVASADPGKRQVHVVGSVAAMSAAFGVTLSIYHHQRRNLDFRCPEGEIHIPQALAGIITGVFGLNTMPIMVRHSTRVSQKAPAADVKSIWPTSFFPQEVAKLYNFPPGDGAGQRIAVLEFGGGFDPAVLKQYFTKTIGLPVSPTVNAISVLGVPNKLDQAVTGEVYLDIEVIGAMAPKATIDVYFAPFTGEGFLNSIVQALHNDDYAAISISYGFDEDMKGSPGNPAWPMLKDHIDEAFGEAIAIGIPVFVSSGDQGSGSQRGQLQNGEEVTVFSPAAHAAYPSTSPYATSVGGTLLYAKNGAITHEVVWNELGELQQGKFYIGGATGGGVSDRYPKAPSYQTKAGIALLSVNAPPAPGRCIPDVAGNAGASTGYLVSQPPGSKVPIAPVGGTSAAAPMWAALWACVRTALNPASPASQLQNFFFNDFVYAVGSTKAFNNIVGGQTFHFDPAKGDLVPGAFTTAGDNRSSQANGYFAKAGYDLCTGWGTPNGVELLKQLQAWLAKQPNAAPAKKPAAAST
jgi:kumamolisin